MPQLLIMRHAKSDWGDGCSSDEERPLAPRGIDAAKRIGVFLSRIGAAPELVLTSPAVRARTTAELAGEAGGWSAPMNIVGSFYGGVWSDVVDGVIAADTSAERILVAGHEPTWSELVSVLTGGGRVAMPTGAVAALRIPGNGWAKLAPGKTELQWLVTPRMLEPLL